MNYLRSKLDLLVTVHIVRFLDEINQSLSESVLIVKPEDNFESRRINLDNVLYVNI